jgi:mono/diheme cytochrome c family protein
VGATDLDLARARDATSRGAVVFANECASCHGRHGEGLADSPAILGPAALPEYPRDHPASGVPGVQDPQQMQVELQTRRTSTGPRDPFRTARDIYAFVSTHSRRSVTGPPKVEQDWAIVTFLMAAQGESVPDGGLTSDNAVSIPVSQR